MSERPIPAYVKDGPIMAAALAGLVEWCWSQPDAHAAFCEETGKAPLAPVKTPLDAMIDAATGYSDDYMEAFVAWVIRTQWGEDGDPALDEARP